MISIVEAFNIRSLQRWSHTWVQSHRDFMMLMLRGLPFLNIVHASFVWIFKKEFRTGRGRTLVPAESQVPVLDTLPSQAVTLDWMLSRVLRTCYCTCIPSTHTFFMVHIRGASVRKLGHYTVLVQWVGVLSDASSYSLRFSDVLLANQNVWK